MTQKQETWTVLKILDWTKGYLGEKGVENARLEAEWMLSALLSLDRVGLYLNFDKPLNPDELVSFRSMVGRRAKREPLQYILGTQEFMGFDFEVGPGTLIPRHDTEVLVAEAMSRCPGAIRVVDIGTGSGCIAVALMKQLSQAEVTGVDISGEALDFARRNAERNGVTLRLLHGSLFEPVEGELFHLIVSNPPYITSADLATLQPEVRDHEPQQALDGGADGLDYYRAIVSSAPDHLHPNGWLMVEVGVHQAKPVGDLFLKAGFEEVFIAKDPAGIDRVVGGVKS